MEIQKRIESYWEKSADRYSEFIQKELSDGRRQAWLDIIMAYAPPKKALDVLDIGTGPGFFAIIMSQEGHNVKAIDCTEEMLACARENAADAGGSPDFYKMDCHELLFEDASFDLILCRNLTWTLREPEKAYREWNRVLRPGGRLLVFDANWNLRLFDKRLQEAYENDLREAKEKGYRDPHEDADMEESDRISRELPLSREKRPMWDIRVLPECGFVNIFYNMDITDGIWNEAEKILYRSTPMFLVGGEKPRL